MGTARTGPAADGRPTRSRRLPSRTRRFRRAVLAVVCVAAGLVLVAQAPDTSLVFVSPEDGGYTSGPTPIVLRITPDGTAVSSVSVFADGKLVCTLEHPPFECAWDAGPNVEEHVLRAVAVLADGRRVTSSIRTSGVAYTEKVDVDVVQVTATVTDGSGTFVRGLKRQDFRLYEDNKPQTLTTFFAENVPLELIVAVDVSGSMTDAMPKVKESVKRFLTAIRPTDRVTVLGFNDNVFTLARPSVDLQARLRAIDRLAPWGGTALYDVVVQAFDLLGRQTGRRALVVFSDGDDRDSRVPIELAEGRLEASDAVLYPIGQGRAPRLANLRTILERLARKSGGRAFFGDDVGKLDAVFAEILDELANQYLLGYVPGDLARDGRWRSLRVEVPGKNVRVRARQGYRAVAR